MKYNKQTKEKAKKKQKAVGKSSYHITQNITQNTHLMPSVELEKKKGSGSRPGA